MFQNYFQVALRNLISNKLYSAINIIGLAVGLAACILIALFVRDELSYDKFWQDGGQIHRLHTTFDIPGREPFVTVNSMGPAKQAFQDMFSEQISHTTRINNLNPDVIYGDRVTNENVYWVDPEFVDIFKLDVLKGDIKATLNDNNSIALGEDFAKKYFGDEDPIGKVLTIKVFALNKDFRVGAVYKDIPHNSVLTLPALVKINEPDFAQQSYIFGQWFSVNNHTYFKMKPGVNVTAVNTRLNDFANKSIPFDGGAFGKANATASDFIKFSSLPLHDIQLNPSGTGETKPTGDKMTVLIFTSIAVVILLIACINFMNLATAKSTQRAREVALRKVLGAHRSQLVLQFLSETVLLALIGLLLGLAVVDLTLPFYNDFLGKELQFSYFDPFSMAILLGLVVFVGVVGGFYPALILSGFRPAAVLKANKSVESSGSILFRNILVIFQFAVSISLIIGSVVVFAQKQYALNVDPGYNKENLMVVSGVSRQGISDKRKVLSNEVRNLPNVVLTTFSADTPSNGNENNISVTIPGDDSNQSILIGSQTADFDYFKTYEIRFSAGRDFSRDQELDTQRGRDGLAKGERRQANIIINEAAVRRLGFESAQKAIGRQLLLGIGGGFQAELTVVGVTQDTHFQSLRQITRPEIYRITQGSLRSFTIRYSGSGIDLQQKVRGIWQELAPEVPFNSSFVDESAAQEFEEEERTATMLAVFSSLAVFIACLGLYGLASYTAARRTKEIGIRKVMGATIMDIVKLLIWQFSKPVIIANLIAWPLATWSMIRWLEAFPVRLDSFWLIPLCLGAGLIALLIAWVTVGGNAAKVARSNPVKSMRYE